MGKHEKIEKWNLSMRSGYDLRVLELEAALQSRCDTITEMNLTIQGFISDVELRDDRIKELESESYAAALEDELFQLHERIEELETSAEAMLQQRAIDAEQQHMDAQTIETLRSQLEIARKDVATLYDRSSFVVAPGDMYQPSIFVAHGEDYNTKMLARGIRVFII